jgi:hypothetical protein
MTLPGVSFASFLEWRVLIISMQTMLTYVTKIYVVIQEPGDMVSKFIISYFAHAGL